jgi:hypothetical protein
MDTERCETKAKAHRRWAWLAASIVLLAAVGVIYCCLAPREAVYQGKTSAGVRSDAAVRCLARALAAGGPTLRQSCLRELELSGTNAALALPQVTVALKDPDENIRCGAARALEVMGGAAGPAIPALMRATNDASIPVQRASARALHKIQGGGSL